MSKKKLQLSVITGLLFSLCHCSYQLQPDAAVQSKLTPTAVQQQLIAGNKKYVANQLSGVAWEPRIKKAQKGQYPKAYVLSCVDSRVPVESIFNQSIGDIFVGRVAGNVENRDQLGSMEYAAAVANIKLIVVMGHESCGAVKGACDNVKMGNLTGLLSQIRPAVKAVKYKKNCNSKNKKFVTKVIKRNVINTMADIRRRSKILRDLEKAGKIKIVGAYYSLQNGAVSFLK